MLFLLPNHVRALKATEAIRNVFFTFFPNPKIVTLCFLSCCKSFLEHCGQVKTSMYVCIYSWRVRNWQVFWMSNRDSTWSRTLPAMLHALSSRHCLLARNVPVDLASLLFCRIDWRRSLPPCCLLSEGLVDECTVLHHVWKLITAWWQVVTVSNRNLVGHANLLLYLHELHEVVKRVVTGCFSSYEHQKKTKLV